MRDQLGMPGEGERPTRVRYGVLGFACALSMITYLDRVCMGSATGHIVNSLGLTNEGAMKWAFTAFAFAYAAFEVPSGWLGDVYGPRKTLIRIVLWWSLFTALTGTVGLSLGNWTIGIYALIVIRFLFGMGEAGAYPNITRSLQNWFPSTERGFGQGMVWMSGRLMGGLTPLIWMLLIAGVTWQEQTASGEWVDHRLQPLMDWSDNWRSAFWLFGIVGLGWCALFALWFRNRPEEKASVNAAELALIRRGGAETEAGHAGVPWGQILGSRNLWVLCLMYFCAAYGWYFNITYLPTFLEKQYGVQATDFVGALYKGGPLWMGAIGCLVGGLLTDWFIRRTGNRRLGRRLFGIIGHVLCASSYFCCLLARDNVHLFFAAISLAAFFNDLTMGPAWATCQDIGKRYAGIVAGCMNTIGNMGGALAGWATGHVVDLCIKSQGPDNEALGRWEGYSLNFLSYGVVYLVAVCCWFWIDPTKPVAQGEHDAP